MIVDEGVARYERREEEIGDTTMRQIERQIMLQLIDQRWRDHLGEMDYLREGINLRAMGQRDPLTEWQREGFDLFSEMMNALNVDYVRYVMHVEVAVPPGQASDDTSTDTVTSTTPTGMPSPRAMPRPMGSIPPRLTANRRRPVLRPNLRPQRRTRERRRRERRPESLGWLPQRSTLQR